MGSPIYSVDKDFNCSLNLNIKKYYHYMHLSKDKEISNNHIGGIFSFIVDQMSA